MCQFETCKGEAANWHTQTTELTDTYYLPCLGDRRWRALKMFHFKTYTFIFCFVWEPMGFATCPAGITVQVGQILFYKCFCVRLHLEVSF